MVVFVVSFSRCVAAAGRGHHGAALGHVGLFPQGLQALVEPFDAQRHIFSGDAHSRGSVEVGAGVRVWVRHEAVESVATYGLLLAQRYYPGNMEENKDDYLKQLEPVSLSQPDKHYSLKSSQVYSQSKLKTTRVLNNKYKKKEI